VNIEWAAILSWNHVDGIIRIKNKRDSPAVNFLHWNMSDEVAVSCFVHINKPTQHMQTVNKSMIFSGLCQKLFTEYTDI